MVTKPLGYMLTILPDSISQSSRELWIMRIESIHKD